ncbi:MAG: hypothetical protein M3Y08_11895 [Fibrobacterota bacterium]|nr:hypothetical protein [Fibrobacterota bacterium]
MLRFLISCISTISLLASGLLLWQSDFFPEKLPQGMGTWIAAFFSLFRDPFMAMFLYGLTLLMVVGSWFITEIVLSLLYSIVVAGLSILVLLGFLSVHYPPIYQYLQTLVK